MSGYIFFSREFCFHSKWNTLYFAALVHCNDINVQNTFIWIVLGSTIKMVTDTFFPQSKHFIWKCVAVQSQYFILLTKSSYELDDEPVYNIKMQTKYGKSLPTIRLEILVFSRNFCWIFDSLKPSWFFHYL